MSLSKILQCGEERELRIVSLSLANAANDQKNGSDPQKRGNALKKFFAGIQKKGTPTVISVSEIRDQGFEGIDGGCLGWLRRMLEGIDSKFEVHGPYATKGDRHPVMSFSMALITFNTSIDEVVEFPLNTPEDIKKRNHAIRFRVGDTWFITWHGTLDFSGPDATNAEMGVIADTVAIIEASGGRVGGILGDSNMVTEFKQHNTCPLLNMIGSVFTFHPFPGDTGLQQAVKKHNLRENEITSDDGKEYVASSLQYIHTKTGDVFLVDNDGNAVATSKHQELLLSDAKLPAIERVSDHRPVGFKLMVCF